MVAKAGHDPSRPETGRPEQERTPDGGGGAEAARPGGGAGRCAREETLRDTVSRRLIAKPAPPPGFDPLTASDKELDEYGILRRPREEENPVLFALWQQAVSPPVEFRAVDPARLDYTLRYRLRGREAANNTGGAHAALARGGRHFSSRNWSGAVVVANRARRFTGVAAAWTVSEPRPPPPPAGGGPLPDDDYIATVWVGLDGSFRRSRSLPQAGTSEAFRVAGGVPGAPSYQAWFQWWLRSQLNPPVGFDPAIYPVDRGDRMICLLGVNPAGGTVTILMTNLTRLWSAPLVYSSGNPLNLLVEGSTAEWVVERPSKLAAPDQMHPLPDYGQIVFLSCATTAALAPPLGAAGNLGTARRVRMRAEVAGPPYRSAVISRPRKLGASSLRVRYRAP